MGVVITGSCNHEALAHTFDIDVTGDDQPISTAISLSDLSIVVPFRQSLDRPDALWRLFLLTGYLARTCPDAEIIVSDQSAPIPVARLATLPKRVRHVWNPENIYSPASCKNEGARAAARRFILFLDVDVVPTTALYSAIMRLMATPQFRMLWFPVHFLKKDAIDFPTLIRSCEINGTFRINHFDQVGFTTGIQFFSNPFFWSLGGYDESFRGYGCEDIEMLHRCNLALNWLQRNEIDNDYLEDFRTKDRAEYRGFRLKFAEILEGQLDTSEIYALHVWHDRRARRLYRQMRRHNDALLMRRLAAPYNHPSSPELQPY